MKFCKGLTKVGQRCKIKLFKKEDDYCYHHRPNFNIEKKENSIQKLSVSNKEFPKVSRTKEEMLLRLKAHLRRLQVYIKEFKETNNNDVLGEIAGKLRLLVWGNKKGRNKPLLLQLAKKYDIELLLEFDIPPKPVEKHINVYLGEIVHHFRFEGELFEYSVMDLIGLWSNQSGAAHEDWQIHYKFHVLLNSAKNGIFLNGYQATQYLLVTHATTIFQYGIKFLERVSLDKTE